MEKKIADLHSLQEALEKERREHRLFMTEEQQQNEALDEEMEKLGSEKMALEVNKKVSVVLSNSY